MTKICVITPWAEEISQHFRELAEHSAKGLGPDTIIETRGLKPGLTGAFNSPSSYVALLSKGQVVERIIEAEKEGYDAVVVHCFLDPGVREGRGVVNIPVVGCGEPTLLLACMLGHKFAVVLPNDPRLPPDYLNMIRLFSLEGRALPNPLYPMSMTLKEFAFEGPESEKVMKDLLDKCEACVADGADVVVAGCSGIGPLFTIAGIAKIPGTEVPILDCLAVGLKTAEAYVDFKTRMGLPSASRGGMYSMLREKDLKRVRADFGLKAF